MKYCSNCGKELFDEAVICPDCGCAVGKIKTYGDSSSGAWTFIGFLFPILGFILYLIWKDDRPLRSHSIRKGVRIGMFIILGILILFLLISIISSVAFLIPSQNSIKYGMPY